MTTLPTLARRLRDLGDVPLTAQALADAIDPPAEHWSEWPEWQGGEDAREVGRHARRRAEGDAMKPIILRDWQAMAAAEGRLRRIGLRR